MHTQKTSLTHKNILYFPQKTDPHKHKQQTQAKGQHRQEKGSTKILM